MYVDQDKVDEMVAEAYRQGVNYFDTAPKYCNCNSEEAVGRAVKGFRDKVLLSTKIPLDVCKKPGDYRRALEHSLDKLGTDHLDFYHFWGINRKEFDQTIMAQDLLADAAKAKEEGLIRHISFHDEPLAIKYIIDESKKTRYSDGEYACSVQFVDRTNEMFIMQHLMGWNSCNGSCRRRTTGSTDRALCKAYWKEINCNMNLHLSLFWAIRLKLRIIWYADAIYGKAKCKTCI